MIRDTVLYKPITVLLCLASFRTFFYGLGFAVGSIEVKGLLVWSYIAATGLNPFLFGWIVLLVASASIISLFFCSYRLTNYFVTGQALVWMYVTLCYLLNLDIILALVSGLSTCLIIGYLNFIFVQFSNVMPKRSRKSTPI